MSKILVLGASPLPIENSNYLNGQGIRTWQFVKPLLKDNHDVCLVSFLQSAGNESPVGANKKDFIYYPLPQEEFEKIDYIQKIHDDFNPDCIFSISSFLPSYAAVQLKTSKPLWFDRGDLMCEAQLKSFKEDDEDYLYHFWKLEEMILGKGDIFSTVSTPQKFALIGRLGGAGRLNKHTIGYEFVSMIPDAVDVGDDDSMEIKNIIRSKYVNNDDFVILWSGGYNNWSDMDTLFHGLEAAMSRNNKIKFVSIGGAISQHDESTYSHFLKLIDTSKHKDRYIMLGWLPTGDIRNIYLESNLGINIDKYCYEVVLGSRHRILDWIESGLPVLTTSPSEFTQILGSNNLAFTYPQNDPKSLSQIIIELSIDKEILLNYAKRAKEHILKEYTYENTTKVFREWVSCPRYAPDNGRKSVKEKIDEADNDLLCKIEKDYIYSLKNRVCNLESSLESCKRQIPILETEKDMFRNQAFNLEKECMNFKTHISNIKAERNNLKAERNNLEAERNNLQAERNNLKQHIANLENDKLNLYNQVKGLNEIINKIHDSIAYKIYAAIRRIISFILPPENKHKKQ